MNIEEFDTASIDLWERAKTIYLSTLRNDDERSQADSYFSMISSISVKDDIFTIFVKTKFGAEYLQEKYADKLKLSLDLAGARKETKLEFKVDPQSNPSIIQPVSPKAVPEKVNSQQQTVAKQTSSPFISTLPLEENYTFEEFVQGSSNSWAFAAAKGVANNPGQKSYNPLFIHGGTGLGKTHLMQAIGNELKRKNPSMSICYLTAE